MTLRELYEQHYLPVLIKKHRSPKTIQGYENTLKYWEQTFQTAETFARRGSRTEPDVVEINNEHIELFKDYLAKCPGFKPGTTMSDNTIRRHLRELRPLLAVTTKTGSRDCPGLGLRDQVPKIEMPAEVFRDAEDTLTYEEITAWIDAAKSRKSAPVNGMEAGIWWECLITLIYNTGLRIGTALQIRRDWIDFKNHLLRIKKLDGVKTKYTVTLNAEAMEALNTMLNSGGDSDKVFFWPTTSKPFITTPVSGAVTLTTSRPRSQSARRSLVE